MHALAIRTGRERQLLVYIHGLFLPIPLLLSTSFGLACIRSIGIARPSRCCMKSRSSLQRILSRKRMWSSEQD